MSYLPLWSVINPCITLSKIPVFFSLNTRKGGGILVIFVTTLYRACAMFVVSLTIFYSSGYVVLNNRMISSSEL